MANGTKRVAAVTAGALMMTLGAVVAGPAASASERPASGGDGAEKDPVVMTSAQQEHASAKRAVVLAARAALDGSGSRQAYDDARKKYAKDYPDAPAFGTLEETFGESGSRTPAMEVPIDHLGQKESWWCGPATAAMMVNQLEASGVISSTKSKADGKALTQANLAAPDYLDAVDDGTYRTDMLTGLERWTGWNYYVIEEKPKAATFPLDVTVGMHNTAAMAVATIEDGEFRYNNHPHGQVVDHWIVAYGQTDGGTSTMFADPATTLWSGVKAYFSHDTDQFVDRHVKVYLW